jgi:toxin FitB
MKVIYDTSVLLGPNPGDHGADVAISAVSLAELHSGVLMARTAAVRAERLRRVSLIEKSFDALAVDDAVAREYGRLAAAVAATGRQPHVRVADLLVAATAVAHGATLWTRNAAGFDGLVDIVDIVDIHVPN